MTVIYEASISAKEIAEVRRARLARIAAAAVPDTGIKRESASERPVRFAKPTAQSLTFSPLTHSIYGYIKFAYWHMRIEDHLRSRSRVRFIQRVVGEYYDISHVNLISPRRSQTIVRSRQIAMFLAYKLTGQSYPEIGRRFGGRDHTTVLHAVRKIEALVGKDAKLAAEVEMLRRKVSEG